MNRQEKRESRSQMLIGWREWVVLPELGVPGIKCKVDTGARTSALHAYAIREFDRDGQPWVSFVVHPVQRHRLPALRCEAPVFDHRVVISSNGAREPRFVIRTSLQLGPVTRRVQITLTNRDDMGFRMLLGREALRSRFLVDARKSFSAGDFSDHDFYPEVAPSRRRARRQPGADAPS